MTAEDGKIYEEKAIREWWSQKDGDPTSPSTGAVIGTKSFPAPQARNTIEALVESGAIAGELAEAWKEKLEDETRVKDGAPRRKAATGTLCCGSACGTSMARTASRRTRRKPARGTSAARRPATRKGWRLLVNISVWRSVGPRTIALVMVSQEAALGSDLGAYRLGKAFFKGTWGLPKDPAQAGDWLKKVSRASASTAKVCVTDLLQEPKRRHAPGGRWTRRRTVHTTHSAPPQPLHAPTPARREQLRELGQQHRELVVEAVGRLHRFIPDDRSRVDASPARSGARPARRTRRSRRGLHDGAVLYARRRRRRADTTQRHARPASIV